MIHSVWWYPLRIADRFAYRFVAFEARAADDRARNFRKSFEIEATFPAATAISIILFRFEIAIRFGTKLCISFVVDLWQNEISADISDTYSMRIDPWKSNIGDRETDGAQTVLRWSGIQQVMALDDPRLYTAHLWILPVPRPARTRLAVSPILLAD